MTYIVCHYAEIGLKGNNRDFFEQKLVTRLADSLPDNSYQSIENKPGRIIIKTENPEELKTSLTKVCGLAYFAFSKKAPLDLEEIKQKAFEVVSNYNKDWNSFRITTTRAWKKFDYNSQEISSQVGAKIVEELEAQVDLENPDVTCFIEITESGAYIYLNKVQGPGGLPVGSSGRAVCLLSGGIDSPVAAYKMMKRGLGIDFVHFHAYPILSKDSIEKAKKLFEILKDFDPTSKLHIVSFGDIQKKIKLEVPAKFRILFYRRIMLEIAEKIAHQQKSKALITGESLGQVSSQTIQNMKVTEQAVDLPIFRPLVGANKQEIVNKAKEIDTYSISIEQDQDCCLLFNPKRPETKADLENILKLNDTLQLEQLKKKVIKDKKVLT